MMSDGNAAQDWGTKIKRNILDMVGKRWPKKEAGVDGQPSTLNRSIYGQILSSITPFESYFVSMQSILIWERPYVSAMAFIIFNCFYWFIVSWNRRVLSVIFLILAVVTFHRFWTRYIWPEIRVPPSPDAEVNEGWTPVHPQILSAPEISKHIEDLMRISCGVFGWFVDLRKEQPGIFCLLVSSVLFLTAVIGAAVPGVIIIYLIMMTIALGPGLGLYVIPSSWFHFIVDLVKGWNMKDDKEGESGISRRRSSYEEIHRRSSLGLLPRSILDDTLDHTLGYLQETDGYNIEKNIQREETSCSFNPSSKNEMKFVSGHFNGRNSLENVINSSEMSDEEYEIVTESDLNFDKENESERKLLESDL